ncbi:TPA: hypothetical protein RPV88_001895 [Campylobacter fetus subsp. venerealis]|nr:hypothetical protein [Campylobacter fetus subsp. venerealis]HDX6295837.1 hypothetical protein [Campylobacter fetus subsp. venerealis]
MMSASPSGKRFVINQDLEKANEALSKNYNDFTAQRQAYIDLNFSLAYAYEYDTKKAKEYQDNAEKMANLKDKQDERATYETNEDNNQKIMIPHKDDEKFMKQFQEENQKLYRQLELELEMMTNEARLYQKIKDNKNQGIDKLTPLYVELQEGQIDIKRNPINADRFRHSYPNATKTLEEKVEKWVEKENKKEQGMQR